MISVAGFVALYQLIFKPFYWEKTVHGLHLNEPNDEKIRLKKEKKRIQLIPNPSATFLKNIKITALSNKLLGISDGQIIGLVKKAIYVTKSLKNKSSKLIAKFIKKGIVSPLKYAVSLFL
jgi:hypothetical protein